MEPLFGSVRIDWTIDAVGIAAAVVLAMLARWLLPADGRQRVRLSFVYFSLSLIFGVGSRLVSAEPETVRILLFFYAFFLLASCARSLVLLAVDVVFGRRTKRAPPRIFRDVTQAIAYVVVLMLTLRVVGVEPGSLLTTSALLTAVVGLALQMQRPFEVGDWIQLEQDAHQIGKVTEVNWRATTVMTNDLVELIIPNASLAKAPIRNFSRPSRVSRRAVAVQGPYDVSPRRVHDAILAALPGTQGVLAEPRPTVQTRNFADSGIDYTIHYFTDDYAARDVTDGLVRDRIWYALQRAGIEVPFPTRTVHAHAVSEESRRREHDRELARRDQTLRCVDFLDVLPTEAHRALADAAKVRLYAPDEIIVAQGARSSELYIIDRGEVVVELAGGDKPVSVARLGPGKFFGEMGLMTGEPRAATVKAVTECELLVIDHEAFHAVLASHGDIVDKMSELLARRQEELEAVASSRETVPEPIDHRSKRLISQIRDFFKI